MRTLLWFPTFKTKMFDTGVVMIDDRHRPDRYLLDFHDIGSAWHAFAFSPKPYSFRRSAHTCRKVGEACIRGFQVRR